MSDQSEMSPAVRSMVAPIEYDVTLRQKLGEAGWTPIRHPTKVSCYFRPTAKGRERIFIQPSAATLQEEIKGQGWRAKNTFSNLAQVKVGADGTVTE